jgi:stage II sporulation protein D
MQQTAKKIIIFGIILLGFSFFIADSSAAGSTYIRVAVMQDAESAFIKVYGFYELIDSAENKVILRAKNLKAMVTASAKGINLGGASYSKVKLFIKTDEGGVIILGGRRFRGNICFIRKPNQRLLVVNSIELEDYLKGILYHEVSHYWPTEVLKAQAVVSRTYALYQMRENAAKDYDVTADIYSQVYGGMTSERYRTNRAVGYTKGEVLIFRGKLFSTYFHATCGGHTENASLLWNVDIDPLAGVPCNFCRQSPHFNWQYVLSLEETKQKLIKSGYDISDIKTITALSRTLSGRAKELKISAENKDIKIAAKDFRNIIGPNILRSTNFDVSIVNRDVIFTGIGWGHGVGMCQWGAYFMASHGRNYKEILKYYYPGSELSKNY